MIAGVPAFSAYINTSSQSLTTGTWTKAQFQGEEFDTANAYDNATNYRFQPSVAGYYQINASCIFAGTVTQAITSLYKNGSEFKRGNGFLTGTGVSSVSEGVSALVYLNGSTDYLETYVYAAGTSLSLTGSSAAYCYFQGSLVSM